jgi:heme A synthase
VAAAILVTFARVWSHHRSNRHLVTPGRLLAILVVIQVTLGAWTVLSERAVWINSLHVVVGALVLATSLVLTLRSWRVRFADAAEAVRPSRASGRPERVEERLQPDRGGRFQPSKGAGA